MHLWHLSFIKQCVNTSNATSDAASVFAAVERWSLLILISFEWEQLYSVLLF